MPVEIVTAKTKQAVFRRLKGFARRCFRIAGDFHSFPPCVGILMILRN
jgi:hypothetical protein